MMFTLGFLLISQSCSALANTEKAIFLGPSSLQIPVQPPTLRELKLEALSPEAWSLRTHVAAEFPTNTSKNGQSTWLLLHSLKEGRRYEVRICWAATQPTSFRLETYKLPTVFGTPKLITSLARYSESRQSNPIESEDQIPSVSKSSLDNKQTYDNISSILFLRIEAAADYYTMNKILMEHVPLVFVDIILDPFIFNVLPRSLLPTIAYIVVLAVGSWHLSKFVSRWVQLLAKDDTDPAKKRS